MEVRKDILNKTPKIGDTVVWNPARYKGLVYGIVLDINKRTGLPVIKIDDSFKGYYGNTTGIDNTYTPKTGFVIV